MKPLDEMNPEEIRLEIAERKGIQPHLEPRYSEGYTDDGTDGWDGWFCPHCNTPESLYSTTPCCPNWPEDIAAAWELVDEINDSGFLVIVKSWQVGHSKYVADADCGVHLLNASDGNCWETATTAPIAICKAWLSWNRSEDK